jgi:hypothetical protein
MEALTLYAKRQPCSDPEFRRLWPRSRATDVVLFREPSCSTPIARFPWWMRRPNRRSRGVTINCYRWRLVWL